MNKDKVSEEVAISEIVEFVNHHSVVPRGEEEIKEEYQVSILAVQKGLLVINDNVPVYTLKEPINPDGEFALSKIEFKTRIRPNEHSRLSKGLNLQKESFEYSLRCLAFLSQISQGELNKLSKFDYTVVQQLGTVFM